MIFFKVLQTPYYMYNVIVFNYHEIESLNSGWVIDVWRQIRNFGENKLHFDEKMMLFALD
jgi:hypothetical protein